MTHKNQTEKKEPRAVIWKLFSLRIKRGSTDDRNVDRKDLILYNNHCTIFTIPYIFYIFFQNYAPVI